MKKLGYWKSRKEWKRLTQGMSSDQVARIKQSIQQNGKVTLDVISEVQEEQKAQLAAKGFDFSNTVPEIGKDIAWSAILSMAFRVIDFDRNGTEITNSGKVKAKSQHKPYGYLLVDSPTLNQPVGLPIIHRDDFMLASSVFDDPDVVQANESQEREFLVTYRPEKKTKDGRSASPAHCLHYALVPNGTLVNYYSDDERMARPEPELLFGRLKYSGAISVFMNTAPSI